MTLGHDKVLNVIDPIPFMGGCKSIRSGYVKDNISPAVIGVVLLGEPDDMISTVIRYRNLPFFKKL